MSANQSSAGIYKVSCGEYFYHGAASKFSSRRYSHLWLLQKGNHHNPILQKAYDESKSFSFQIVEEMALGENLFAREQFYIDLHRENPLCCNIANPVGKYMSDEEYNRLKAETPGRYSRSEETKRRIAETKRGNKNPMSRPVIVTRPDGTEVEFPSQTAAAHFFQITQQSLSQWMAGKITYPRGAFMIGNVHVWNFRARFADQLTTILK